MLTETELKLVTQAVDDALSAEQVVAFQTLCDHNPDAVTLHDQLQADAESLRALPFPATPAGLTEATLARIARLPRVTPKPRSPRRTAAWLPFAVAAALLVAVGTGSFLFFRGDTATPERAGTKLPPVQSDTPPLDELDTLAAAKRNPPLDDDMLAKAEPESVGGTDVIATTPPKADTTPTVKAPSDAFGAELMPTKPLTAVDLRLPFVTTLDREDSADRIARELARDPAFRIDLFSKTPAAAWECLHEAARQTKMHLFVDAATQERLNQKLPGVGYALFVDGLTPEDAATFLQVVGKQLAGRPKPETILTAAHFIPMAAADQKDVKELIGVDLVVPKVVKPTGSDPKAVSDGTIGEITTAIKKPGEKAAVMVTILPAALRGNPAKSAEIKAFLDKRGDRKPGTVPLLLVVR